MEYFLSASESGYNSGPGFVGKRLNALIKYPNGHLVSLDERFHNYVSSISVLTDVRRMTFVWCNALKNIKNVKSQMIRQNLRQGRKKGTDFLIIIIRT